MAIKYECDKCGKIYDWYGTVNANKEYDDASWNEQRKMDEEDRAAGRYYGRGAKWYPTNFIALQNGTTSADGSSLCRAPNLSHTTRRTKTMNKDELERRLEAAEKQNLGLLDEIKRLKEKLAEQDKQEIPDSPNFECGESYWTMFDNFALSNERTVFARDAMGYNMFHTEAHAHEFRRKCLMIAMMLHCKWYVDRDYTPDWDDGDEEKWQVFWSNTYKRYEVCGWGSDEYSSVFFSTEEAAQKCADWMNEHWKESADE